MKRAKALLFLTLALCAALLTGCRSNVSNSTDGRVDGTEPSAATDDSRTESESGMGGETESGGMTEASEGTTNAAAARSRR